MISQPKPKRGVTSYTVKATGQTVWFWIKRDDGKIVCSLTKEKLIDQETRVFSASDLKLCKKVSKEINRVSKGLKSALRIYNTLRVIFLDNHKYCQAKLEGCQGHATEIHHKKGRGKFLNDIKTWLAVCRNCHDKIGAMGKKAFALGLSEPRT